MQFTTVLYILHVTKFRNNSTKLPGLLGGITSYPKLNLISDHSHLNIPASDPFIFIFVQALAND